ncbi:putative cinnamyl alcohol dehydrogenase 8B [Zea mays]|uniref:cinnamyl-alcohol dehydrogenase n=2 Tax=Zea mays TaxID=4577 RepID=A0A3L6DYZ7_MAIZE|nr:putative cinnamyl alcohol dehydrogenase 8B [Zea mays]
MEVLAHCHIGPSTLLPPQICPGGGAAAVMSYHCRVLVPVPFPYPPGAGAPAPSLGVGASAGPPFPSASRALRLPRPRASVEKREQVAAMEEQGGQAALGWAARDDSGVLSPYSFSRRVPKDDDVTIKVLYCGICHTDLHVIKNDWRNAMYPVVPGHEIVGVVTGVGGGVTRFKAGDTVGVGYFAATGTMDGIIDTVSAWHPITPLLALLKPLGQMVIVGAPSKPLELPAYAIVPGGKGVAGNNVGSVRDCQAMLEFAGKHGIGAEVEVIKMDYVNTAMERLEKNDVRYRFVIDVAGSLGSAA